MISQLLSGSVPYMPIIVFMPLVMNQKFSNGAKVNELRGHSHNIVACSVDEVENR